jgi:sigma54-dependent transcription regulator
VYKFAPVTCEQDNWGAVHDNMARLSWLSYRHWLLFQASSLSASYGHLKTLSASITTRDKLVAYESMMGAVLSTSTVNNFRCRRMIQQRIGKYRRAPK